VLRISNLIGTVNVPIMSNRPVALTGEHPAPNRRVGGSNPSRPVE
jgi:hypothetical protein